MSNDQPLPRHLLRSATAAFAALALGFLGATSGLLATDADAGPLAIHVTSGADDGSEGTLRAAIDAANTSDGADRIEISGVDRITIESDLPSITDSLLLTGPGAESMTVDAGGNQLFVLEEDTALTIEGMTLTGAEPVRGGLALNTNGTLIVDDVVLAENHASPDDRWEWLIFTQGGGVTTLRNTTATDNDLIIVGSDGGNTPSDVEDETTFENRTYVIDSTFTGNRGASAIHTERFLSVSGSVIADNEGYGINAGGLNGASITSSTVSRNGHGGIVTESWGHEWQRQQAVVVDDVEIRDNTTWSGIRAGYWQFVPGSDDIARPTTALQITNSTICGNDPTDLAGMIDESNLGAGNVTGCADPENDPNLEPDPGAHPTPEPTVPPTPPTTSTPANTTPQAGPAPTADELSGLTAHLTAPSSLAPGQSTTLVANGFTPGEQVQVYVMSDPLLLGQVLASANGTAEATVTIPDSLPPGVHHLYMIGLTSRRGVGAAIVVITANNAPEAVGRRGAGVAAGAAPTRLSFAG